MFLSSNELFVSSRLSIFVTFSMVTSISCRCPMNRFLLWYPKRKKSPATKENKTKNTTEIFPLKLFANCSVRLTLRQCCVANRTTMSRWMDTELDKATHLRTHHMSNSIYTICSCGSCDVSSDCIAKIRTLSDLFAHLYSVQTHEYAVNSSRRVPQLWLQNWAVGLFFVDEI